MTLPASYFDEIYAGANDPWGFQSRWYERRKRALTLSLLPAARYGSVFEPGCSIGILTRDLAGRCDALLATDVAHDAVGEARRRNADLPHVEVRQAALPEGWPSEVFDLVVISEVGYYFSVDDLSTVARRSLQAGTVVAVHWRHEVADYPRSGDEVHAVLHREAEAAGRTRLVHVEDLDLVADVWTADPRSVAAREGLS